MKKRIILLILVSIRILTAELWLPCPSVNSGHYEISAGLHFWNDHLFIRNIQFRTLYYAAPGLRINSVIRTNDKINQVEYYKDHPPVYNRISPIIDELYLEHIGFLDEKGHRLSNSIKLGITRYLHFPYYGLISRMDQVTGMADIRRKDFDGGYRGALWNFEYQYSHFGYHNTVYYNLNNNELYSLENYFLLKYENEWLSTEARAGRLIIRDHDSDNVLLDSGCGYNLMAGIKIKGYDICLFWEEIDGVKYTGLSIKFAPSIFSRSAGKVRLDYNRACEGFVFQYPLIYKDFGITDVKPENMKKVGEIAVERVITFWRIGMQRNFYEHIVSHWGNTDYKNSKVVIRKEPMLLGIESIVSPVHRFIKLNDIKRWDSNGIRPGQLTQIVIYEFYQ